MPVSVSYTWSQTAEHVTISAHITQGSINKQNVDIQATHVFLKLNCPPSLLQLDLYDSIDAPNVRSVLFPHEQRLELTLHKAVSAEWPALEWQGDKKSKLERRQQSLVAQEADNAARHAAQLAAQKHLDAHNQQQQWNIHTKQQEIMHQLQAKERVVALEDLKKWTPSDKKADKPEKDFGDLDDDEYEEKQQQQQQQQQQSSTEHLITPASMVSLATASKDASSSSSSSTSSTVPSPAPVVARAPPPPITAPIRARSTVSITFTPPAVTNFNPEHPSVFLPARESNTIKDQIRKAVMSDDVKQQPKGDMKDNQPIFLKEKADEFFRKQDYQSALAAYSSAIDLESKMSAVLSQRTPLLPRLYSNRSICHMCVAKGATKRASLRAAIQDCESAIAIIADKQTNEEMKENSQEDMWRFNEREGMYLKLLNRRATAYSLLGLYPLAIQDFQSIIQLQTQLNKTKPATETVKAEQVETNTDSAGEQASAAEQKSDDVIDSTPTTTTNEYPLPSFDLSHLQSEITLFQQYITAYQQQQVDAYKREGDRLLSLNNADSITQAISTYSHALLLQPSHLAILHNRSVAYLSCNNYNACMLDCTQALSIWSEAWSVESSNVNTSADEPPNAQLNSYNPTVTSLPPLSPQTPTPASLSQRARLLSRRALCRLATSNTMFQMAINDLQQAASILQSNDQHSITSNSASASAHRQQLSFINADLEYVKYKLRFNQLYKKLKSQCDDTSVAPSVPLSSLSLLLSHHVAYHVDSNSACSELMTRLYNSAHHTHYSAAQLQHIIMAQILSDRAALELKAKQFSNAKNDCLKSLTIYQQIESELSSSSTPPSALPAWLIVTRVRLGSAHCHLHELADGERAYTTAIEQWRTCAHVDQLHADELQKDLENIRNSKFNARN